MNACVTVVRSRVSTRKLRQRLINRAEAIRGSIRGSDDLITRARQLGKAEGLEQALDLLDEEARR